jgi:hypothetical protein
MNTANIRVAVTTMAIALSLAAGCGKLNSGSQGESAAKSEAAEGPNTKEIDKHGDEILASTAKAEARQWMRAPSHIFFKADAKEVAKFVEDFYRAGATQVLIADIEEHEGKQFGEALLVVLPKAADARARLFEIGTRADAVFQNDPVSDKQQKYLYYSLD